MKVVQYGDKILKRHCKKIENIDKDILKIVKNLEDTLDNCDGIGLAAPQIGIAKRIIRIDLKDGSQPISLINPEITKKIGKEVSIEGCLSYVGYEGEVVRPKKVYVEGMNTEGKKVEYFAEGLLAKAFCHEIDHLDGIMYMDRARKVYKLEE
ncbi:peptide deformylase [Clostridium oryzae]